MRLALTHAEQRQLAALSDTLLSPLAATQPDRWRESVEASLQQSFGCDHVMFVAPEEGRAVFRSPSIDADVLQVFAELTTPEPDTGLFASKDPVVDTWFRARRADRLEVFTEGGNASMLAQLGLDMRRSEIANTVWRGGMLDFFGLMTEACGSEMMLITGFERRGAARLDDDEIRDRLSLVLPAFRAGHHAQVRFGHRRAGLTRTLDFMNDALLLFDRSGRELHRNAACARLLDGARDGEQLLSTARQMALRVADPRRGLAERLSAPGHRTLNTADGRYSLRALSASPEHCDVDGAVLVSLERAAMVAVGDDELRRRWKLTPREIEVARLLADGCSNSDVAERLGVSAYTARNHTERVLMKLGLSSRARVGPLLRGSLDVA